MAQTPHLNPKHIISSCIDRMFPRDTQHPFVLRCGAANPARGPSVFSQSRHHCGFDRRVLADRAHVYTLLLFLINSNRYIIYIICLHISGARAFSASSTMRSPMRSLTEPPALKNSHFASARSGRNHARGCADEWGSGQCSDLSCPAMRRPIMLNGLKRFYFGMGGPVCVMWV